MNRVQTALSELAIRRVTHARTQHALNLTARGGFAACGPQAGDIDRLLHGASAADAAAF